jgi:hypothetical protein
LPEITHEYIQEYTERKDGVFRGCARGDSPGK